MPSRPDFRNIPNGFNNTSDIYLNTQFRIPRFPECLFYYNETLYNKLCNYCIAGLGAGIIFTQYGNILFFYRYKYL